MISKRVRPSIYTYNLLLKCTRECGLGDEFETRKTIGQIIDDPHLCSTEHTFQESPEMIELNNTLIPNNNVNKVSIENRPNLLDAKPFFGNIVGISAIKTPQDR